MLKRRKPLSSRRATDNYQERDPTRVLDRESVSREFNETMETIQKYADNGSLPQIYDPLKSCFEVLKPFHLSDLDNCSDLEQYFTNFPKKSDGGSSDVSSAGDASQKKTQKVFIPPLNLSHKNGSDGTDSDVDGSLPNLPQVSPKVKGKFSANPMPRGDQGDTQPVAELLDNSHNSHNTSFEYRFLSSDEKTQSDDDTESESSKKSRSDRKKDKSKKLLRSPNSMVARVTREESPKRSSSARSKKSRFSSSSSDEMGGDDELSAMIDPGHPSRMTDSQVTQELRLADERATRTVKMIEQIREAIAAYQEKDTMTEEENRELKRNQQKLSKNLQQLEKITARVKQLVGLADKSFKKKWEELEKSERSQVEEDLKAGGDTAVVVDPVCERISLQKRMEATATLDIEDGTNNPKCEERRQECDSQREGQSNQQRNQQRSQPCTCCQNPQPPPRDECGSSASYQSSARGCTCKRSTPRNLDEDSCDEDDYYKQEMICRPPQPPPRQECRSPRDLGWNEAVTRSNYVPQRQECRQSPREAEPCRRPVEETRCRSSGPPPLVECKRAPWIFQQQDYGKGQRETVKSAHEPRRRQIDLEKEDEDHKKVGDKIMTEGKDKSKPETAKDKAKLDAAKDKARFDAGKDKVKFDAGMDKAKSDAGKDKGAAVDVVKDKAKLDAGKDKAAADAAKGKPGLDAGKAVMETAKGRPETGKDKLTEKENVIRGALQEKPGWDGGRMESNESGRDGPKDSSSQVSSADTPRTKIKKDLNRMTQELTAGFDDSEVETTDLESPTLTTTLVHMTTVETDKKKGKAGGPTGQRPLLPTESLETKMAKILGGDKPPLNKVQSISALDCMSGFKATSLPCESDTKSVPEVMLSLTGRLSESYCMQEKLAAENADLEGLRYQLQEELITKENEVELLQRKVANLQAEMRLMVRETAQLNDRRICQGMNPPYEDKVTVKVAPPTQDDVVDMKLEEYRETTQTLESTVCTLEAEVKRIQQELQTVQKERQELENHRKMMKININVQRRGMGTHGGLISPLPPRDSNTELQVRELKEQYDRLQQDFNNKLLEVASLRAQNDKLMEITDKAREEKDYCEEQCKSLEKRLKQLEGEKTKMLGSKEQLFEQEQQMSVIKARFREAQDEIDELRNQVDDQTAQLDDYRHKYLQAQQQVEEQIRQIDHMELEHQRAREEQNAEIQRVKQCFQEKLSELTPLADILKETQMKLQEAQQLRMIAERNFEDLQRELQESKERSNNLLRRIESERSTQQLGLDERSQMAARLECWEKKCNELREENAKLKTTVVRLEEASAQNEKRLDEKLHEVAQFSNQLETLREESARQVARCKDRNETVKRSLQNQIADLERQLAQARATARTAQKDKDEIRQRMQTQINNLNDNFEQAQLRIKSLQSHVNFLKNSYSGMFSPEASNMSLVDSASGFLIEPPCNPCDCTY